MARKLARDTSAAKPSDEDLEMLTPEEREAFEGENPEDHADDDPTDLNDPADSPADGPNDTPAGEPTSGTTAAGPTDTDETAATSAAKTDAPAPEPKAPAAPAPAAETPSAAASQPPAAEPPETVDTSHVARGPARPMVTEGPADYDAQMERIKAARTKLDQQFVDGDITTVELQDGREALFREEVALDRARDRAQLSMEAARTHWITVSVERFLDAHPVYRQNETLFSLLDLEVRNQQSANPADQFDPRHLEAAHAKIQKDLPGIFGQAPAQASAATSAPAKDTTHKAVPTNPPTVPSLAGVPAAAIEDTSGGKFARLDRLAEIDPERFEAEIAKLSAADRDEYLAQ